MLGIRQQVDVASGGFRPCKGPRGKPFGVTYTFFGQRVDGHTSLLTWTYPRCTGWVFLLRRIVEQLAARLARGLFPLLTPLFHLPLWYVLNQLAVEMHLKQTIDVRYAKCTWKYRIANIECGRGFATCFAARKSRPVDQVIKAFWTKPLKGKENGQYYATRLDRRVGSSVRRWWRLFFAESRARISFNSREKKFPLACGSVNDQSESDSSKVLHFHRMR